jgi:hypothetical protein
VLVGIVSLPYPWLFLEGIFLILLFESLNGPRKKGFLVIAFFYLFFDNLFVRATKAIMGSVVLLLCAFCEMLSHYKIILNHRSSKEELISNTIKNPLYENQFAKTGMISL